MEKELKGEKGEVMNYSKSMLSTELCEAITD